MEFQGNILTAEMSVGGVEAEYEIHFDFNYSPVWIAPNSGTSMAMEPDEPEEYEFNNFQMECVGGSMRDLTDVEVYYVMERVEDLAKKIVEKSINRSYDNE